LEYKEVRKQRYTRISARVSCYFGNFHKVIAFIAQVMPRFFSANNLFQVCVQSQDLHYGGGTKLQGTISGKFRLYLGDRQLGEFDVKWPNSGVGVWGYWCGNQQLKSTTIINCLNSPPFAAADFKNSALGTIKSALGDYNIQSLMREEIRKFIRESNEKEIRTSFGRLFLAYVSDEQNKLKNSFVKVDAFLGALKVYFVLALPEIWAAEDGLRDLIDGRDDSMAVIKFAAFTAMMSCTTPQLCSDEEKLKRYTDTASSAPRPPYWWSTDTGQPTPLERFGDIAAKRLALLNEIVASGPAWDQVGSAYHPMLFSAVSHLSAFAPQ
jgi:hypothetical protein